MIDEKKVIFSKTVRKEASTGDEEDTISVSLECDEDVNVQISSPSSITTYEALNAGPPVVAMAFIDGVGDLLNAKKLDTQSLYRFKIGTVQGKIIDTRLRLSHIENANSQAGQPTQSSFIVYFVHDSWKNFSYLKNNDGWSDVKYSDVVNDILSGVNVRDVKATDKTIESVTMPYWTTKKMIDWICKRAKPASGSGEYKYCINLNNDFFFAPFSDLIDENVDVREDTGVTLEMGSAQRTDKRPAETSENANVTHTFMSYSTTERSNASHSRGAGGVKSSVYDFNKGEYVLEDRKYSETSNKQLCSWSLVNEADEDNVKRIDLGRNFDEREAMKDNTITDVVNKMQEVTVSLNTSPVIRPGEVVNLVIPIPKDNAYQGMKNEIHSGYYVVSDVEVKMVTRKGGEMVMRSDLTLIRQGINAKENNYYTSSQGGKK